MLQGSLVSLNTKLMVGMRMDEEGTWKEKRCVGYRTSQIFKAEATGSSRDSSPGAKRTNDSDRDLGGRSCSSTHAVVEGYKIGACRDGKKELGKIELLHSLHRHLY